MGKHPLFLASYSFKILKRILYTEVCYMRYRLIKIITLSSILTACLFAPASASSKQSEIDAVTGPAFTVNKTAAGAAETQILTGVEPVATANAQASKDAPKSDASAQPQNSAPEGSAAASSAVDVVNATNGKSYRRSQNLGAFRVVSYCDSTPEKPRYTAGGTIPKANHTVSTDWSVLPKGTKIMIGDSNIVYTVEDTGVKGRIVDIFQSTLAEARAYGEKRFDIYIVEEIQDQIVPPKQ